MQILRLIAFSLTSLCMLIGSANVGACSSSSSVDESIELGGAFVASNVTHNGLTYRSLGQDHDNETHHDTAENLRRHEPRQKQFHFRRAIIGVVGFCIMAYEVYSIFNAQNQLEAHEKDWNKQCVTFPCNDMTRDAFDMNPITSACFKNDDCFHDIQDLFKGCYDQECLAVQRIILGPLHIAIFVAGTVMFSFGVACTYE